MFFHLITWGEVCYDVGCDVPNLVTQTSTSDVVDVDEFSEWINLKCL